MGGSDWVYKFFFFLIIIAYRPGRSGAGACCMSLKITIRQLEYFNRIVAAGSIRKAAGSLGVTQPAVTQAIRELELSLGVELMFRTGTGISLTKHGDVMYRWSANVLAQIAAGMDEVKSLGKAAEQKLVVCGPTVGSSRIVARAVARFKKRFPLVTVLLNSSDHRHALQALQDGDVDVYFGRRMDGDEYFRVKFEPLFQDRLILVSGLSVGRSTSLDLAMLADRPWVIPGADSQVSSFIHEIFRDARVPFPKNYVEMNIGDPLWEYIRETGAVSIVPSNLVAKEIEAKRLFNLGSQPGWILPEVGFGLPRKSADKVHIADFIQELRRASMRRRSELKTILTG